MISLTAMSIDDLVKVLKQSGSRHADAESIAVKAIDFFGIDAMSLVTITAGCANPGKPNRDPSRAWPLGRRHTFIEM